MLLLAPAFSLPLRELGAHYHARAQAIGAAVRIRNPAVIYQRAIAAFYTSTWMGAGVIDAANMTAYEDFDDDLWTDAEERAMSTDPFDPMSRPTGTAPRTRDVGF